MSKHSISDGAEREFWKKVRFGAAAAVTLGTGVYAITSALKQQGVVSNFVMGLQQACQAAAPQIAPEEGATPPPADRATQIEQRAVLNLQLEYAMQRRDVSRVRELARQIDLIDRAVEASFPGRTHKVHPATRSAPETTCAAQPQEEVANVGATSNTSHGEQSATTEETQRTQSSNLHQSGGDCPTTKVCHASDVEAREQPLVSVTSKAQTLSESVSRRKAATAAIKTGDIVEAMDPVVDTWSPATIHSISKNGLVKVRWHNPGCDPDGNPWHPIGEVWAEQIVVKHRKSPQDEAPKVSSPPEEVDAVIELKDGLAIGDLCYAKGKVVEQQWFHAKVLGTRARSPSVRVEFLSTLSGKTLDLMLPSMRKDFVKIEDVRRVLPVPSAPPQGTASTCLVVQTDEQGQKRKGDDPEPASQDHANDNDDVVIDRDLMCSLCQSPEDDANMLVCDCKRGFHIYCISPPLDAVPEGEWKCPICTEAAAQPDMI